MTTVTYDVAYAGLVTSINFSNIDPSGRTDLLKILDEAQKTGTICKLSSCCKQVGEHLLIVRQFHMEVVSSYTQTEQVCIPLNIIASVGYIEEDGKHIIAINIAPNKQLTSQQNRDIAVLLVQDRKAAETLSMFFENRFQAINIEIIEIMQNPMRKGTSPQTSSNYRNGKAQMSALDSAGTQTSIYTSTTDSSLIESAVDPTETAEYMSELQSALTADEVREMLALLGRRQTVGMAMAEFAYKLMELFGKQRWHLLIKFRPFLRTEDQESFVEFLNQHNIHGRESHSGSVATSFSSLRIS